jgi:hypothetical protein
MTPSKKNLSHFAGISMSLIPLTQRMVRKGTALILLWLMTVVVATSQPGLSYCLCLQTVFVGECECVDLIHEGTCSRVCDEAPCDCCSQDSSRHDDVPSSPCQDCSLQLQLDLDDFVGADSIPTPSHEGFELMSCPVQLREVDIVSSLKNSIHGIRGSPPPIAGLIPSISLRVRYSVFLV